MKTCIIFGGSRFLGLHLTVALQHTGYAVTHFRRGHTFPATKLKNVRWIAGDRNSPEDLSRALESNYDLIVDLSGYHLRQVNPIFQQRTKIKRYLFCSTSSVVDRNTPMPYDENSPCTKDAKGYGAEKLEIERFLIEEYRSRGTPITIFRPQGIFGNYDFAQPGQIFRALLAGEPIVASEIKWQSRLNLLDVEDFTSALLLSIPNTETHGKIYHLANSEPVSLNELVTLCSKVTQLPYAVKFENGDHPSWWHDYDLITKNEAARRDLGLSFRNLEDSLNRCYIEYQRFRSRGLLLRMQQRWNHLWLYAMRHLG